MATNIWDQYEEEISPNSKKTQEPKVDRTPVQDVSSQSQNGSIWDKYEEDKPPTFGEKALETAIEVPKGLARIAGKTAGKIVTGFPKMGGAILQGIADLGSEGEPGQIKGMGTRMIRGAGEYISKFGEEQDIRNKKDVESLFGSSYGIAEDVITDYSERWGSLVGSGIPPADAFFGAGLAETAEKLGAPEWVVNGLEIFGVSGRSLGKGLFRMFKDRKTAQSVVNMLKQNPRALGELSGLAGVTEEAWQALSVEEQAKNIAKVLEKESQLLESAASTESAAKTAATERYGPGLETIEGTQQQTGRSLKGRVTAGGEDIGVRPADVGIRQATTAEENLVNVLDRVHVNEIGNKRIAGETLKNTVMQVNDGAYELVNTLYNRSRELNAGINGTHPDMVRQLHNRLENLRRIPRPSSVQRNLMGALEEILEETAIMENGVIIDYRSIDNQVLIDQIQSLRQTVDFDFEHGSPKGIFRPVIQDIQNSVLEAAEGEAAEAFREAGDAYADWTRTYNNKNINPFRDASNQNYEKLLDQIKHPDDFNMVQNIVRGTESGEEILGATQRKMVDDKLRKFVEKPNLIRSRDFRTAMSELESALTPEQMNAVQTEMESQVPQRLRRNITEKKAPKGEKKEEVKENE